MALGVWARRALLVSVAGVALLLNLLIQYFAKIGSQLHWGLVVLGFGLLLLALAVFYERRIKHLLPQLTGWA